uniref:Uncharacterized protein n=1 Tax=Solanum lycopersicum TaxID=4081 RepID=A0A3Q7G965_SOLLC
YWIDEYECGPRYLEQPKAQQHQLQPQQAAVEQVNDESLHGSSIKNPESGVGSNHQLHTTLLSIKTTTVSLSALIAVLEYTTVPFGESFCRNFENIRGIGIIEMPFRRNILAFVGHGDHPKYPRNKVMIWDDQQSRCIHELCFWSEVRRIRLLKDCLVNFSNLELLFHIETTTNPKRIYEVSQTADHLVLVCPGLQKGQVWVKHSASKSMKSIVAT